MMLKIVIIEAITAITRYTAEMVCMHVMMIATICQLSTKPLHLSNETTDESTKFPIIETISQRYGLKLKAKDFEMKNPQIKRPILMRRSTNIQMTIMFLTLMPNNLRIIWK